jgi:hypothetical protein
MITWKPVEYYASTEKKGLFGLTKTGHQPKTMQIPGWPISRLVLFI